MNGGVPPHLAEWLLERCGVPDVLIGDLREAFALRRSRVWYWRQAMLALLFAARGAMLRTRLQTIRRVVTSAGIFSAFAYTAACGPKVDVATGVRLERLETGWTEVGSPTGFGTKLVPSIAFRLTNVSEAPLPALQVNAIFRRGNEEFEWGNDFRRASGSEGLAPGATTRDFVLTSPQGYTGVQAAEALLQNARFVDARVDLFGKYASTQWVKLGEFPVARTLLP
jgi:hypothetical protein